MALPLLVLALTLVSGAAPDRAAEHAEQQLQGTWTVVSWTEDLEEKTSKIQSMSFAAGKLTIKVKGGKEDVKGTYQLIDAAREPPTIRIKLRQEVTGIYEFGNDSLKLCLAEPRQDPPTEFKATFDSTVILLKREKR